MSGGFRTDTAPSATTSRSKKRLERAMKQFEAVDVSSSELDEGLRQLQTVLADHVEGEGLEQFPELRRRVPAE
jgi:hypothetical protein